MNPAGEEGDSTFRARVDTRCTLLKFAVELLGRATVAQRLNVPGVVLDDWIDGYPPVPDWKVTALVELIDAGINGQAWA
jgi:hypothetical protein